MKKPIHRAIADVLRAESRPMSAKEIHDAIEQRRLYAFKTRYPLHVVKSQLRRHCQELDFPSARPMKYFTMKKDGRFELLPRPIRTASTLVKMPLSAGVKSRVVSVPTDTDEIENHITGQPESPISHTEIQWRLLDLGARMNMSIWAPRGDRGRMWEGHIIGNVPGMLNTLPLSLPENTLKVIANIDVLWIQRGSIVAGFEVEHTSHIYSGLLRMTDLLAMQPNIDIKFYLVAPEHRSDKFAREVIRPAFSSTRKPLRSICRFLPYSSLVERLEEVKNVIQHLSAEFLNDISDSYDPDDETEG